MRCAAHTAFCYHLLKRAAAKARARPLWDALAVKLVFQALHLKRADIACEAEPQTCDSFGGGELHLPDLRIGAGEGGGVVPFAVCDLDL